MAQCEDVHFLLYAIDGTDSAKWRPENTPVGYSHVFEFHNRFNPINKNKVFKDGPNLAGTDVGTLISGGMQWVTEKVKTLRGKGKSFRPAACRKTAKLTPSYGVEIVLVGHSRGAVVAGDMARKIGKDLGIGVYFLGMFDAVDRSWDGDGGKVENVELTAHAVRNPSMPSERGPSRSSFGNTYMSSSGYYRQELFNTSHGGVGGSSVTEYAKVAYFGDYSCAMASNSENLQLDWTQKAAGGDPAAAYLVSLQSSPIGRGGMPIYVPRQMSAGEKEMHAANARRLEERKKTMEAYARRCETESTRAYRWMITQAVSCGLAVS